MFGNSDPSSWLTPFLSCHTSVNITFIFTFQYSYWTNTLINSWFIKIWSESMLMLKKENSLVLQNKTKSVRKTKQNKSTHTNCHLVFLALKGQLDSMSHVEYNLFWSHFSIIPLIFSFMLFVTEEKYTRWQKSTKWVNRSRQNLHHRKTYKILIGISFSL